MTWFESLTGFSETTAELVRSKMEFAGDRLTLLVNNRSFYVGEFTTPTLKTLRQLVQLPSSGKIATIGDLVADVRHLHQDAANANSVFQVASQFNCLEMATPYLVPEDGVGIYENDRTQGPACCISAGAGTIYRNYFVKHNGKLGQTSDSQIDCLASISRHFDNESEKYWMMQNGYCFPTDNGLLEIESELARCSESQLDLIREKLMVGIQANTEVTLGDSSHRVTQVFCSALPIAYSKIALDNWDHFPRLILDATYEMTFYSALHNFKKTGCPKLYLTLVGGGVFGNKLDWILSAIGRSMRLFQFSGLDVKIVSYDGSDPSLRLMPRNC